ACGEQGNGEQLLEGAGGSYAARALLPPPVPRASALRSASPSRLACRLSSRRLVVCRGESAQAEEREDDVHEGAARRSGGVVCQDPLPRHIHAGGGRAQNQPARVQSTGMVQEQTSKMQVAATAATAAAAATAAKQREQLIVSGRQHSLVPGQARSCRPLKVIEGNHCQVTYRDEDRNQYGHKAFYAEQDMFVASGSNTEPTSYTRWQLPGGSQRASLVVQRILLGRRVTTPPGADLLDPLLPGGPRLLSGAHQLTPGDQRRQPQLPPPLLVRAQHEPRKQDGKSSAPSSVTNASSNFTPGGPSLLSNNLRAFAGRRVDARMRQHFAFARVQSDLKTNGTSPKVQSRSCAPPFNSSIPTSRKREFITAGTEQVMNISERGGRQRAFSPRGKPSYGPHAKSARN
ncbi:hypothetical protein LSTR_LSTR012926, partial [Laodelphax striatellus]